MLMTYSFFFLWNPRITVPNLISKIRTSAKFSYKHAEVCSIEPINGEKDVRGCEECLCCEMGRIAIELRNLYQQNFTPMLKTIGDDIKRWDRGLFTQMGRCSIIKKNVLSRVLYRISALPIHVQR